MVYSELFIKIQNKEVAKKLKIMRIRGFNLGEWIYKKILDEKI